MALALDHWQGILDWISQILDRLIRVEGRQVFSHPHLLSLFNIISFHPEAYFISEAVASMICEPGIPFGERWMHRGGGEPLLSF
jgi:hypothetical protein